MAAASFHTLLKDEDRQPYYDLIRQPRMTIADAHQWLTDRGYKVSRVAVRGHFKAVSDEHEQFLGMTDDAQRELVRDAMRQLTGPALASLTRYAVYLAGEAAKKHGPIKAPKRGK